MEQVVDEGRGSALFHGCSTAVPRLFHESPPYSRGTSWTVLTRGTAVERRGPGPPSSRELAPLARRLGRACASRVVKGGGY